MSTATLQDAEKCLKRSIEKAERSRKAFMLHRRIEGDIFKACTNELRSCKIQKVKSSSAGEERYSYLKSEHLLLWEKYDFCQHMPIVVTGPNSSGKSTFINKLIGISIMPVDEGSVSKRVVRITYADVEQASLKVYDNYRHGVADYGSPVVTVPLSGKNLSSKTYLREIMKKHLKPEKEVELVPVVKEAKLRNGCSTSSNAYLDTTNSESHSPESDGNKEDDEVEEYEIDRESKEWYQKMVVVSIPSEYLKMGVDIYDTPGPDLRDDIDMALLRKNCSELLQQLVPLSVVVFLLPNPSVSNDVREALEVLTDAIGTVKEREPRVYFLHNKYCCSSLLYDHNVKESDPDYDTKVREALKTARNDSLETFRKAFPTSLLTSDEESGEELYDIVDMLDEDGAHMDELKEKVKRRLLSTASAHMDSLTNMLVKGLCAAVSNVYDQMEIVSTHSAKDIDEITNLMEKFEKKFRKKLKQDLKVTLEKFPPLLVATLKDERAGILDDFKSNPISTVKTGKEEKVKMYQGYRESHRNIRNRLKVLIKDRVVAKASLQLQQDIGGKVQEVLQETFTEFENNEKYGPMLLEALDFDGVEKAIQVSGPSLKSNVGAIALSMVSTAASIVFRVVIVDAVAAATVAAISVAFAVIGGIIFLTTLVVQIKKCREDITEDRVRDWVLEKLDNIEKKYSNISPEKIVKKIRKGIQEQILSRLNDNLVNYTNAKSMKAGIPRLQETLGKFQNRIDQLNWELALILNDADTSVDIGECIHDGEGCKVYSACLRDQEVVVRVPAPVTSDFHHEVVKLRHLNEWNVRNVVPFFGVTRVQLEDEETVGMTFLKMKGSLREYLTETPTVEGDFRTVLRMATCITESLESFLETRDQNLAQTALNLDSSKLFIDDSGSCYVSDFFSENYPQGPYRRHGNCTSPQRNLHSDIRSLGAVLFELFPKKEYVPPNDDEEVIAEVKVLLEEERPKVQSMYLGIVANCFEEKSPPNPTEVLEGLTKCDNLLD